MVEGKYMSGGEADPKVKDFLETIPKAEKKNLRIIDVEPKYLKSSKISEVALSFYEFKGETCVDLDIYNKEHPDTQAKSASFNLQSSNTFMEFLVWNALGSVLFEDADSYAERRVLSEQFEEYIMEKSGLEKK